MKKDYLNVSAIKKKAPRPGFSPEEFAHSPGFEPGNPYGSEV